MIKCYHTGDESRELQRELLWADKIQKIARTEPCSLEVLRSEGIDGGEGEEEEAASEAAMEEVGGECGVGAGEGGVVVEREVGGARLVLGGGGGLGWVGV